MIVDSSQELGKGALSEEEDFRVFVFVLFMNLQILKMCMLVG